MFANITKKKTNKQKKLLSYNYVEASYLTFATSMTMHVMYQQGEK